MIKNYMLMLICLVLFYSAASRAENKYAGQKQVDKELGVWTGNNDVLIIVFFADHTMMEIGREYVEFGSWKRNDKGMLICDFSCSGSTGFSAITIIGDKLIYHHGDYDDDGYHRLLEGGYPYVESKKDPPANSSKPIPPRGTNEPPRQPTVLAIPTCKIF